MTLKALTCCLAVALAGSLRAAEPVPDFPRVPPTEPADALKTFRVLGGFRMELIAAEPLVADPVDLAYDPDGRAYIVEFRGYPKPEQPTDPAPEPIGRVRLLEDVDGDGTFDRSDVFADGLQWPTSVVLWKKGVFVAAPPDLWYFEDTGGDRVADVRRKVFTGFGATNIQAVMNNLRWGLDHRIYGAAAGNGGSVVPADDPAVKPVLLTRRDFRFDPETLSLEPTSGGQRFGNAFDDWGNRFLCNIRNPVQHVVLPSRYLDRNRHLIVPSAIHDVAEAGDQLPVYRISPPEPWRVFRAQRWAKERANFPRSELVGAGYFTSSSGVTIYRGDAFPPEYRGNAFVADVAANIVHREVLEPDGVTFKSHRGDEGAEFVASTDPWFRPVNFINAPDGTLTVLDMYRETIEHPWSIPDDIRAKLDLSSGNDRGRLYRLTPPGFAPRKPPRLSKETAEDLARHLESPNAWHRETAHRLIHERQDRTAVEPLRKLLRESDLPQARLHALWSLDGLGDLTDDDLLTALADAHPAVREHAVLVAEPRLATSPALAASVIAKAEDADPRVRMQTAFTLGLVPGNAAVAALARIARRDAGDEWLRTAVLSSAGGKSVDLLSSLTRDDSFQDRVGGSELVRQLALFAGAESDEQTGAAIGQIGSLPADAADLRYAIVTGLADGLLRRKKRLADFSAGRDVLAALLDDAEQVAADTRAPLAERLRATDLLRHGEFTRARRVAPDLLAPRQPQELRLATVHTLGAFTDPAAADLLVNAWRALTPAVRAEAIETLLRRPAWVAQLLSAIETGVVHPSEIPVARRNLLLTNKDDALRARAERIFGASAPGPRSEAVDRYREALSLRGRVEAGQAIFRRECATCHRVGSEGHAVGPSLATVKHRSPEEILTHVLDPNREVSPDGTEYAVTLADGRILTGLLAADSSAGLTLRRAQGVEETIPKSQIEEISGTGRSLMPEGLERTVAPQDMADLIAFLKEGQ